MLRTSPTAKLARGARFLGVALTLLASPVSGHAGDFSLKLEPGVAIPLTKPQSDLFGVGGAGSLKLLFGLTPYLDVGPTASLVLLSADAGQADPGVAWGFGAGLRLKRPHAAESFHGISPWLDADALYIRTGALNRPGFATAVGLAVPIGESRRFWVGPFARYHQVIQPNHTGFDNSDAKTIILGVSFEVGSGVERKPETVAEAKPEAKPETLAPAEPPAVTKEVEARPDRDNDGVPDDVDRCPDVSGPKDNDGCPRYEKLVVKPDKLEVKEKIYFVSNSAKLEKKSFPVLDEVVQALKDNKGFRVQVEGHADSSGPDARNQTLSGQRAQAVLDYLVAHGVAKDRLISKGFSSSVPIVSNTTVAGREKNRRVEFVILNGPSAK